MILRLFGAFAVEIDGRPLPSPRSRKGHWLLALLALRSGRAVDRAWLSGLLWPDSSQSQALYNLRRALVDLRHMLGSEAPRLCSPTPHSLALDLSRAQVDVIAFDAAIARGDDASLQEALELHRGPLLQECSEEWVLQERAPRAEAFLAALETLGRHAMARGDRAAAARDLRRLVAADPLRDSAQRALMEFLARGGEFAAATQVYREFRLLLHHELNAAPDPETIATYQQIRDEARKRLVAPRKARIRVAGAELPVASARSDEEPRSRRRASDSGHQRLPRPLTRLVGREPEVRRLQSLLLGQAISHRLSAVGDDRPTLTDGRQPTDDSPRLVTLTGSGGVGKTRLAIQVAEECQGQFPDGVWFVDLTALPASSSGEYPGLVPQAVAAALDVREQPAPSSGGYRPLTETLQEFLSARQLLLVLDNCEHLLPACAELAEALLSACPGLRILATSRQSLGLTGEVTWPLPGLSVPSSVFGIRCSVFGAAVPNTEHRTPNTEHPSDLLQFDAVRLFVERAREATAAFALTERSAGHIAQICRRLDGLPLALELAAARLKVLAVHEIAARLDDRFSLLTGGSRTALPRQQTLRAAMDWSYELLSEPERLLLQRLSVFAGGWTLAAAEAVCGGALGSRFSAVSGDRPVVTQSREPRAESPDDVLDLLTQLVDQSLVIVERAEDRGQDSPEVDETGTRYRLLETMRQYARERLRAGAPPGGEHEAESVRRRHLEFYLWLAEEAALYLAGPDQAAWLERLDIEMDNLRAALDWAVDREPEQALRLAVALARFWEERRYLEEGRQRLTAALGRVGPGRRSPAGAWALTYLGWLTFLGNDHPAARGLYEESLALQQEFGDSRGIASALWGLGNVARRQEEYARARALHEESLTIRRAQGDRNGIALSLIGLADTLQEQGDDISAWAGLYEEALAIRRELGDRPGVAGALGELANVAWRQGDYAHARRLREESLALWRPMGSRLAVIHSLGALGHLARDQGEYEDARAFYSESLDLRRELGDRYTLVQALEDFAELAAREGEWARMTRLFGAADSQREAMGKPLRPPERREYDRYLSVARGALGEAAVAAEWEAGRGMSLAEAITFARVTDAP